MIEKQPKSSREDIAFNEGRKLAQFKQRTGESAPPELRLALELIVREKLLVQHAELLHLVVKRNATDTELCGGIFAMLTITA